jgi:outer membrane protein TolC
MFARLYFFVLSISLLIPAAVLAQPTYTSDECLAMAKSRNPMILASIERKTQAAEKKDAIYGNFLPKLNLDYSYTYFDKENSIDANFLGIGEVTTRERNNFRLGIYIDQPLFTGFRLTDTYNLADLGLKEAVAGEQLATLEITYQTLRAYYNYLMAQKIQKVADEAVIQLSSHLYDSEQFFENEIIPLNSLLESKVHLANAKQDAKRAAGQTRIARMQLATVIKEPLASPFLVADTPDIAELNTPVEELIIQALQMRPELRQANYKQEAAKTNISLAKSAYYPTIMLSAGHNRYGGDAWVDGHGASDIQDPEETMIGVYATWELFAWGQTNQRVRQASAADREARQNLTAVIDAISLEVQDNYIYATTSYGNIESAKIAVEQAKENLRMSELRYKNQIATNTDVLDARTLLSQTETNYYRAIYEYNIGLAGISRAVGVHNRQEFALNNQP